MLISRDLSKLCAKSWSVLRQTLLLAPLTLSVTACGYFFGPRAETPPPVIDGGEGCFSTIGPSAKAWALEGKATIAPTLDCAVAMLDKFEEWVEGESKQSWSKIAVLKFAQLKVKNPDLPLWMDEIFRVKTVFFGGSADQLTRDEFSRLRRLIINLKTELEGLSPAVGVATFQAQAGNLAQTELAANRITRVGELLIDELQHADGRRSPVSLNLLFSSLKRLGVGGDSVESWQGLVLQAKAILIGGNEIIEPNEWPLLVRTIAKGWSIALNIRYRIGQDALGTGFPALTQALNGVIGLADQAISVQPTKLGVKRENFDKLVVEFKAKGLLPYGLTSHTISKLLPKILGKMLAGNSERDQETAAEYFGPAHLAKARAYAQDWVRGQRLLLDIVGARGEVSLGDLRAALKAAPGNASRDQLVKLLSEGRALIRDANGRLVISAQDERTVLAQSDLNLLNAIRIGTAVILRGYAHDRKVALRLRGIDENESHEVYVDLRELAREMGLIDVRNNNSGRRTFMEANLFTSVSDGDDLVSLHEGIEWFHIVLSGGLLADVVHKDMAEACGLQANDVYGRQLLKIDCFRKRFAERIGDYLPNLPGLVAWMRSQGPDSLVTILHTVEEAARTGGKIEEPTEFQELRAYLPILHYTENLFMIHDKNTNGILDNDELWNAFPVVRSVIRKLGDGKAESQCVQEGVFSRMIQTGAPPDTGIATKIGIGLGCVFGSSRATISTDRLGVLRIMSSINTHTRMKRIREIKEQLDRIGRDLVEIVRTSDPAPMQKLRDLFQCQEGAQASFNELMKAEISRLAPGGQPLPADQFIKLMKTHLKSDSRFHLLCLPF